MEKREQEFASEKPEGKGVVGRQPSLIGSVVNPVAYSSTTIVANGILISSKFAKKKSAHRQQKANRYGKSDRLRRELVS